MRKIVFRSQLCRYLLTAAVSLFTTCAFAATPQEQSFIDAYRKALEANDVKTLESFLYVKNPDPDALEFFKSSLPLEEGFRIAKLELLDITPEEVAKAVKPLPGPNGELSALPVKPSKKFVITVESKEAGESSLTTQRAVGEVDGSLKILVPSIVKK